MKDGFQGPDVEGSGIGDVIDIGSMDLGNLGQKVQIQNAVLLLFVLVLLLNLTLGLDRAPALLCRGDGVDHAVAGSLLNDWWLGKVEEVIGDASKEHGTGSGHVSLARNVSVRVGRDLDVRDG